MAKVLEFPVKKELPKEVRDRLHEIAALYVKLLNDTLHDVCDDIDDEEELNRTTDLMLNALIEGVLEAIRKTAEES